MKGKLNNFAGILLLVCIFLMAATSQAQQLDHEQGQIIVQLKENVKGEDWIKQWGKIQDQTSRITINKQLSRPANIYLLEFDYTKIHERIALRSLQRSKDLLLAQFNHFIQMRTEPNDEQFSSQWQYLNTGQSGGTEGADIDVDQAWDVTTGGVTLTGDTIVVAVLDDGLDVNHEDIQRNRWINHAEIPDNDIDDDENGYIDDYQGWSIISDSDNISGGGHGTPVAGIIGADGNNEIGVTGVSWNVKVMMVKNNFNTNEAQVLAAYSYPLEQRMRYNESGGTQGAFVVATNASWGVNNGNPEDAPIWCSFYDTLGEAGILNCGATANADINVDEDGDLPTACSSDYLISVTNMNHNDMKVGQAGYGLETIDLGAFGAETFTLANNNGYEGFGGTSGAAPHVAGTVGLLYSLECPALMGLVQADPAAAALLVKAAVLDGTDPNASLAGITVTGGRLNVMGSINQLLPICDGCIPASSIHHTEVTDVTAQINWNTNDSLASVDIRWRAPGELDWVMEENAQNPLILEDLLACQEYEYQFRSNCHSDTIEFGNSFVLKTDGCCEAPRNIIPSFETTSLILFNWDAVLAALAYEFSYRVLEEAEWINTTTTETMFTIGDLASCERYEYRIRTLCINDTTDWTPIVTFLTQGCGPCLDLDYCIPGNIDNSEEYIGRVEIEGLLDNMSMAASEGYFDYGPSLPFIEMEQGGEYFVRFTPGFEGTSFAETWRLWLDIDQNGIFSSSPQNYEIVFTAPSSTQQVDGSIQIPADADLGTTRLRVAMKFSGAPAACSTSFGFGEVEDYCVNIVPTTACVNPSAFTLEEIDTTSAKIDWDAIGPAVDYEMAYRLSSDVDWTTVSSNISSIELENLQICSDYIFRIKSLCAQEDGVGHSTFEFATNCATAINEIRGNTKDWTILPNPFQKEIRLKWLNHEQRKELQIVVLNAYGRQVFQPQTWQPNLPFLSLNLAGLPAGVYTINLIQDGQLWSAKRVVKIE